MYPRHNLVWLNDSGWRAACAGVPDHCVAALQRWQHEDWPAVVRRADTDAGPDTVSDADRIYLGVALPPDLQGRKVRVPFKVAAADIRLMRPPLEVIDVLPTAPLRWQPALRAMAADLRVQQLDMRVYGSLALQTLTRQAYLRDASDIDILFRPADRKQLAQGLALLTRQASLLPLDGEVLLGGDHAVAWKEWLHCCNDEDSGGGSGSDGAQRVLVKRPQGVQLQRVDVLLAALDALQKPVCKD